ncbi:MAG TPA: hypothetical protein V6D43_26110 [Candidatus Sericytochromatia bacterium]
MIVILWGEPAARTLNVTDILPVPQDDVFAPIEMLPIVCVTLG